MRILVPLALAFLCVSTAHAASHTQKINARNVIPSGYGRRAVFQADLDSNGGSQIVADAYTFYYTTQTDRTAAVEVLDPANGYRVSAMLNFAPDQLITLTPLPNPSGLPHAFVTVAYDQPTQSMRVDTWTGASPRRVDSFTLPIVPDFLLAPVSAIGDLDGNGQFQLVLHAMSGLQVIDLSTHAIRATSAASCREIHFVAYGGGNGRKILCLDSDWQSTPPQIIDGNTGATLFTAPTALGSSIASGGISSSTPDELVYFDATDNYLKHVDLGVPWAPTQLSYQNAYDVGYNALSLLDLDHDGRADDLLFNAPFGLQLLRASDMTLLASIDFNAGCEHAAYAVGYFDQDPDLKIFCSGTGFYSGQVRTFDPNAAPLWGVVYHEFAPSRPAVGHVTAGGEEDVVTILGNLSTDGSSELLVQDGASLNELSRTDIDVGAALALARNKSSARQDIVAGGLHSVEKIVPGSGTPEWTYTTSKFLSSLAPVDIDGDGQDEVLAVSYTTQTVASGGFSHLQALCDVAMLRTSNGSEAWSLPTPIAGALDADIDTAIAVMQADGSGANDVIVSCGGTIRALKGENGATLWEIADGAVDMQPVVRDGRAQLLIADRTHMERRDPSNGQLIAALNGNAESLLDLGSDDNLLVRQGDGTLRRFDAVRGVSWDGPSTIGDYSLRSGLAAASPWTPTQASVHVFANTAYGVVRVDVRTKASIFTDGFEAADTP